MKSRTKYLLKDDQIIQLVKANFGDKTEVGKITELKGGLFNSAYAIERINEKDKIVLKVSVTADAPLLSYEKELMLKEVEVYRFINEQTTIPAPKILCYDFSKKLIKCNYFFMTYLKGETMYKIYKKLTPENLDIIKKELGQYMAQIHKIKGTYFGYFADEPSQQFTSWKEAYLHMIQMILSDGKKHRAKLPYERVERAILKNAEYLEEIREPRLVDYDLWAGNIFLIKNGNEYHIEAIVDFERAFWGDPYADFSSAVMTIKDIRNEPVFWESYTDAAGINKEISRGDVIRMLLYKLYVFLIMMVDVFRYGFFYGIAQRTYAKSVVNKCLTELETY